MRRTLIDSRYLVLDELGDGGMAKVYLAQDGVLDRTVALKALREQYADDEEFVERFKREARSAAALSHPNIVQVYDQGRAEDGTYYMAMEYVPGGTLKDRIANEGPLDPNEAAGVALRIAEALDAAHGRGIVHRDVKSRNVLLTATGGAKVADFGIARAASSKTMTGTNLVLGTAAYMSPEQVRGERVGPASDLYSLGVVLYEMLTGQLPYDADSPIATAMKHLDEPPRHPSEDNPGVPEGLDAVTAKLLAKRPEDRYASAAALAADLRRVRDGLPPLAADLEEEATAPITGHEERTHTAPTLVAPARARGSRRRLLPLIALLLGAALLGGLAWTLSQNPSEQEVGAGRVEVPDVVGLTQGEAAKRLEDAGLKLGSEFEVSSDKAAAGTVVKQDPEAGTRAERGIAVNLTVSTGPEQAPATPASTATSTATSSATPTPTPSATPSATTAPDNGGQNKAQENRGAQNNTQVKIKDAQKALNAGQKEMQNVMTKEPKGKAKDNKR